jgi:hypothetical protein
MPRFLSPRVRSMFALGLLCAVIIGVSWAARPGSTAGPAAPARPQPAKLNAPDTEALRRARQVYGQMPLSFEANRGQTNAQVNFIARGPGYNLFLTPA